MIIIDGKDLENMEPLNCSNCYHRSKKYKIPTCKVRNKQVKLSGYCFSHTKEMFLEDIKREQKALDDSEESARYDYNWEE